MGTNNAKLMNDELYVGWKHERVTGADYDRFLDHFAGIVDRVFPNALLHFGALISTSMCRKMLTFVLQRILELRMLRDY